MEKIDLGNGYVRIANKLLEIIYSSNFNATQMKILLMVMRYTYGFNRKSHSLSISFISKGINADNRQIRRELSELIEKNVIQVTKEASFSQSRMLGINKNYHEWGIDNPLVVDIPSEGENTPTREGENTLSGEGESTPQDKTNIKTNIKTGIYPEFFESFYKEYPNPKGKAQTFQNWKKVTKQHEPDLILESAKRYKKSLKEGTEKEFITTSYNFLGNKAVYLDYISDLRNEEKKPMREPGKVKEMSPEDLEELFEKKRQAEWGG